MLTVCCAIIEKNGKVLTVQRSNIMSHPLKWEFPGGKIKSNETPEECIVREIKEELRLEITLVKQLDPVFHIYPDRSVKLIPFICKTDQDPQLTEHSSQQWLLASVLKSIDWIEADIDVVDAYLSN